MRTALGIYSELKEKAQRARILSVRAASYGKQSLACRLTAKAIETDRLVEEWRAHVPEWQWQAAADRGWL